MNDTFGGVCKVCQYMFNKMKANGKICINFPTCGTIYFLLLLYYTLLIVLLIVILYPIGYNIFSKIFKDIFRLFCNIFRHAIPVPKFSCFHKATRVIPWRVHLPFCVSYIMHSKQIRHKHKKSTCLNLT